MALTIYGGGYRLQKIQIAAKYVGQELNVAKFTFGVDNKTPEFLSKHPLGKVPVLETPHGPLFESNAIIRYIARLRPDVGLYGNTFYQQAQVDQWLDFCTSELEPPRAIWYYTVQGYLPGQNPKPVQEAKKDVEAALKALDSYLLNHTFLAGNQITIADIVIFSALVELYSKLLAPATQKAYGNLLRWFNTVANQPEVLSVVGKVTFATAEAQVAKAAPAKKEEKPAAKKEEKSKEAPKPAAASAAAAGGDDDDEDKPKEKKKNPLDDLPPTSMQLDPIKKLAFSARPILPDFFEQLWPQFDAQGYTWYVFHYKYNAENTVYFKTGNLVGGFIQRSDASRKYSMGVINVYGNADEETGPWKVSGAWLFRGPGIIAEMIEENPDSEYYEWKKVDVGSEEGKKAVKEQFMAEQLEGEPVLDRRFFK